MTTIPATNTDKPTKIRRTRDDWLTLIKEWEATDQTQQVFCEARSLCYRQFSQWKSRIKKEKNLDGASTESAPMFVPIQMRDSPGETSEAAVVVTLPNRIQVSLSHQGDLSPALALIQQLMLLPC